MDFYSYITSFPRNEHMWEYYTELSPVLEQGRKSYYAMSLNALIVSTVPYQPSSASWKWKRAINSDMESIANLFGQKAKLPKKTRHSERGDLIEYFYIEARKEWDAQKYGILTISRIAWKLSHLKVKDLYYLKSICEDSRRRGGSWAKTFWGSLKTSDYQNN